MSRQTPLALGTSAALAAALALPALTGTAAAQDRGSQERLSRGEIEDFFETAEEELVQAIRNDDSQALGQLIRDHLVDTASWTIQTREFVGDQRVALTQVNVDPKTLASVMGAFHSGENWPRDYDLSISLTGAEQLEDPREALAFVRYSMSGIMPTSGGAGQGGLDIEGQSTCQHLLKKWEGEIRISYTTCEAQSRIEAPRMVQSEPGARYSTYDQESYGSRSSESDRRQGNRPR